MTLHYLLDYFRLVLYPIAILGFVLQIANEYTEKKCWRRIFALSAPVLLLTFLMVMNILTAFGIDADDLDVVRDATLTPILLLTCVAIWNYTIRSTRMCGRRSNNKPDVA